MKVGEARAAAIDWVRSTHPGAAYFSGSTVDMPDSAELPVGSDVDIMLVSEEPTAKLGKFPHRGALLEATYVSTSELASPEEVLSSYHLAHGLRTDTIIADPTGFLRPLQATVGEHFADEVWVRRRCAQARNRVVEGLRRIDHSAPWHVQVTSWLFPTGISTHIPLVAALRNPTVRLRYLAVRDLVTPEVHTRLLELLGSARLTPQRVSHHVDQLAHTFDAAAAVARTPFPFSTDITPAARPIAVDASHALAASGAHREVMFWITATFARCHLILAADAPELHRRHFPAFEDVCEDLGITSSDDLTARATAVLDFLPALS
ncbi:hypothetical protein [Allokutzneria oryzae]|uniref:Nucleotidyltransferase domain-containing protein n=1 Tax=Allokutzneria oryzae TaxID=1378989 RepID=A0ABV5ZND7_9PSEU